MTSTGQRNQHMYHMQYLSNTEEQYLWFITSQENDVAFFWTGGGFWDGLNETEYFELLHLSVLSPYLSKKLFTSDIVSPVEVIKKEMEFFFIIIFFYINQEVDHCAPD